MLTQTMMERNEQEIGERQSIEIRGNFFTFAFVLLIEE